MKRDLRNSWPQGTLVRLAVAFAMAIAAFRNAAAQQLDDSCTVTVNGQTVQVNPDGTFVIPNVAAPDLFGPGGPGTAPDFLSDDFLRLVGTCTGGGPPQYVYSECFRIRRGESFAVGELTISGTPPQAVASILAAPGAPTLTTVGQQTPINLTGFFTDGSSGPLDPNLHCPATFRTSNAAILTVAAAPGNALAGSATAKAPGTALITVSLEGATAVTSITVSLGDPLTSVTGIVQTAAGDPLNGATVRLSVNGAVISGTGITGGPGLAAGQFMVPNVASQLGPISVYAEATFDGASHSGVSPSKPPVPGGFTDAGLITLDDRILWITNANGSWQNGSNWISGAPPTANQIAVIDVPQSITVTFSTGTSVIKGLQCAENLVLAGGSLTINGESTVDGTLTLSGATFGGTGLLTVTGPLNWTNGTMSGTGTTVIGPTGTLSISGVNNKSLFRALENHSANASWTDGHIIFGNGTLRNESDGTLTASLATSVSLNNNFGINLFRNAGIFNQAGPGTTTIGVPLNNTGEINVLAATLQLIGGGTSSGSVEVGPGAALGFAGTHTFAVGSSVTGLGSVTFTGGTHSFPAGSFNPTGTVNFTGGDVTVNNTFTPAALGTISGTLNSNAAQTFSSVTLTGTIGGTGLLTVTGPLSWTNGTMSGTGTTVIGPTGTLSISGVNNKSLFRTLENHSANASWTDSHIIFGNGTLRNESDGTLTASLATSVSLNNNFGTNLFHNAGVFNQAGPSTVNVGVPFNNTGAVNVQAGTLIVSNSGTSSGDFEVGLGTTLNFTGTYTHDALSAVINHGTLGLGGAINTFAGIFTSDAILNITGTANLNADYALSGTVNLSGTLGGTGRITIAGPLNWTIGTMSGTGTTVIGPTGTLSISGVTNKSLFRVLENHSANASWTDSHIIFGGGTLINESDGTFTAALATNVSLNNNFGINLFRNAGTFNQASAGIALVGVPFNNSGTVNVPTGTLQLVGAFTQTDGSTELADGSITKTSGVMQINGGTIGLDPDTPSGTITGSVTLGNAAAGTVPRAGAAATLTVTGVYTQTAGTLDIELGGTLPGTEYDRLVVGGNAALGGVLQLTLVNGFVPEVGQQFQVLTSAGTVSGAFTDVITANFPPGLGASVIYTAGAATVTIEPD